VEKDIKKEELGTLLRLQSDELRKKDSLIAQMQGMLEAQAIRLAQRRRGCSCVVSRSK